MAIETRSLSAKGFDDSMYVHLEEVDMTRLGFPLAETLIWAGE